MKQDQREPVRALTLRVPQLLHDGYLLPEVGQLCLCEIARAVHGRESGQPTNRILTPSVQARPAVTCGATSSPRHLPGAACPSARHLRVGPR